MIPQHHTKLSTISISGGPSILPVPQNSTSLTSGKLTLDDISWLKKYISADGSKILLQIDENTSKEYILGRNEVSMQPFFCCFYFILWLFLFILRERVCVCIYGVSCLLTNLCILHFLPLSVDTIL